MYQFMQIYGNCIPIYCFGKNRLKGPIDNVQAKNSKVIELLYTNSYFSYIQTAQFNCTPRVPAFDGDSAISYTIDAVRICHNDPRTIDYLNELKIRCENMTIFLSKIRSNDEYYLTYALNLYDIDNHKLINNNFIKNVECLAKLNLLDKTLFIGSINGTWGNFWSNDIIPIIKKYNLKYIEIEGLCERKDTSEQYFTEMYKQFYTKAAECIEQGTDKKYLKERFNYEKPSNN